MPTRWKEQRAVTAVDPSERTALQDDELLGLIVEGDEQALGTLYDRYGRLVYSIALRCTADQLSAEEVTQDVFQRVWQQAGTFRVADGSVAGWMVGITRHRAIDEFRSRRKKARALEIPIDEARIPASSDGRAVDEHAVLRIDVCVALTTLPLVQRQAIELAYYGGLTCSEIACSLGTPVGTVKTRLRLGLEKLRATLLPGWEGEKHVDA